MQLECTCSFAYHSNQIQSSCILNPKFAHNTEQVVYLYSENNFQHPILISKCDFEPSVASNEVRIQSEDKRLSEWEGKILQIMLFPKYYLVPWKSLLYCVSNSVLKDSQEQDRMKEIARQQFIKSIDWIQSIPVLCTHKQQSISTIHNQILSYIIHTVGYCDHETEIVFQSNLLFPVIPHEQHLYQLPQCTWKELESLYPSSGAYVRNHHRLEEILKWNCYVYRNIAFSSFGTSEVLPFESSNVLIKGGKGSGKTSLIYDICEKYHIPCFLVRVYDFTIQNGSDAYKSMEHLYNQCKQLAPSVLLLDTLHTLAVENTTRRVDRSEMDLSLLSFLSYLMKDSKENGVTVVGIMNDETTLLSSVLHSFDETIECYQPNQNERHQFIQYCIQHYVVMEREKEWEEAYLDYCALHTPSYSWSDLTMIVLKALHRCKHFIQQKRFCCLCYLQTLQEMVPSVKVSNTVSSLLSASTASCSSSLPDFKSLLNDFTSIGGNKELKQYLTEYIINPSLQQEKYQHFHIRPPTGILLYGPPGTGKTAISRACSQLGHFNFIAPEISDLICKEVGESERRIRELFMKAKKASPCILFFDEIESIFKNRNDSETSNVSSQILTQLLLQIDSIHSEDSSGNRDLFVFIIGATNLPHLLDPSLLRPGRLDKLVLVPLPNIEEREEILHIYADPILLFPEDCSIHSLAEQTEGYSGADLKYLVRYIILHSLHFEEESDTVKKIVVSRDGIKKALFNIKPTTNKIEYERILKWKPEDNN